MNRWDEYAPLWRGMRVMITGGAGFLGYRLARVLKQMIGCVHVYGLDIQSWWNPHTPMEAPSFVYERIRVADVTDYRACERAIVETKPDVIFHLAAISQVVDAKQMPLQAYLTNIMGTANILEAARQTFPGRIVTVVASSDKAYGTMPMVGKTMLSANEHSFLDPIHPYDVSKASADFIARSYGRLYGERTAITRCGNIYGPGDDNWQRIIPGTIRSYLFGNAPIIRSDGSLVREYNFIDDIIEAYLLVAWSLMTAPGEPPGKCWTISDEAGRMNVMAVVEQISRVMRMLNPGARLPQPVVTGKARDEGQEIRLSSERMRERFGWRPRTSFGDGLRATIEWAHAIHGMPLGLPSGSPMVSFID